MIHFTHRRRRRRAPLSGARVKVLLLSSIDGGGERRKKCTQRAGPGGRAWMWTCGAHAHSRSGVADTLSYFSCLYFFLTARREASGLSVAVIITRASALHAARSSAE